MLNLTSAMALIPFLLVAAYGLLLARRGETYEARPQERTRDLIIAGIAALYTLFLLYAGGMKFIVLSAVLYAPGTVALLLGPARAGQAGLHRRRSGSSSSVAVIGARRRHLRAGDRLHHHLGNGASHGTGEPKSSAPFGVHSEVGQLRKVMVCAPGRAHQRLTPRNCDTLLFDDVLWVDNAKRDHFDFMQKMRDRGIEVVEMHNLLAETVAIPEAKKWILDNQVVPNQVGPRPGRRDQELPRRPAAARTRRDPDRRPVDRGVPRDPRRRDAQARQGRRRRHRVSAAAAAQHALHARHDLLDLRRRHAQPAVSGRRGTRRRSSRPRSTSSIPTSPARSTSGGAIRPRTTAWPRSRAAT